MINGCRPCYVYERQSRASHYLGLPYEVVLDDAVRELSPFNAVPNHPMALGDSLEDAF
jgi:hypothetical protein